MISVRPEDMQQGSRLEDMQQEEHQGPRTLMCPFETLRRGPWLTHGKTNMYVQIPSQKKKKPLKIQQNRYFLCNPWSKPVRS